MYLSISLSVTVRFYQRPFVCYVKSLYSFGCKSQQSGLSAPRASLVNFLWPPCGDIIVRPAGVIGRGFRGIASLLGVVWEITEQHRSFQLFKAGQVWRSCEKRFRCGGENEFVLFSFVTPKMGVFKVHYLDNDAFCSKIDRNIARARASST
jgi:hypothetical protein